MNEMKDAETEGLTLGKRAKSYDKFAATGWRARAVLRVWPPSPGERVLDVGCGPGTLSIALKEAVGPDGAVDAIDAAAGMIDVAQRKDKKCGAGVNFQVAAIEKLPFEDSTFDKVYATLMVHHLPPQLKREGFKEVARVLKPAGGFLVVDFGPPSNWFARVVFSPIWLMENYFFSSRSALAPHFRGEIPDLLIGAAFQDTQTLGRSFGIVEYILATL